jgi:hypothetical protein
VKIVKFDVRVKCTLYSLSPVTGFPEISPNTTREITFFGANWAISKSDVPPNWYIDADGLSPRVFESTSGDFVRDFTEPSQWKRTNYDLYNPYTPMDRFERYKKIWILCTKSTKFGRLRIIINSQISIG